MNAGAGLAWLLLPPRDEDFTKLFWVLVFFGLPLLGRLLQWILRRAGLVQEAQAGTPERSGPREEWRRKQQEGSEVWRRLLQGDETPPPAELPAPPVRSRVTRREADELEVADLEGDPRPLSVLGEAPAPSETAQPVVSLEDQGPPAPLDAFTATGLEGRAPRLASPAFLVSLSDARRAVVLSEILGPPLSQRRAR